MTFNEFFEKQIGFMVENLKKLASQMKENLEAYEKEGKK